MKSLQAIALTAAMAATPAVANEIIVDNLDGTAEVIPIEVAHPDLPVQKNLKIEPSLGTPKYLNIAIDTADKRFVDTLELVQSVTNPEYVEELFDMIAGNGVYESSPATFRYDSYGKFVPDSDFLGVYHSGMNITGECTTSYVRGISEGVWPIIEADMIARNIDLKDYDGLVWWLPFDNSCTFSGFAYTNPIDIFGNQPLRLAYTVIPEARTLKHELGHTRGLKHLSCKDENGVHIEYCEGGLMGAQKNTYVTLSGNSHPAHYENLVKIAANNQFALGWTELDDDIFIHQDIKRSGTYLISNHEGDARDNENPEVLRIEWPDKKGVWFISYEELDGYNPELNVRFRDSTQIGKVTVRSQRQQIPSIGNSFREALLEPGECYTMGTTAKVCLEGFLNNGEEAEVFITRYGVTRSPSGRVSPSPPVKLERHTHDETKHY